MGAPAVQLFKLDDDGNPVTIAEAVAGTVLYEGEEEMTRDAAWEIASITKVMTAVEVMMLVERGLFTLDTPVKTLLEWLPEDFHKDEYGVVRTNDITVDHLLRHSAGLPDYWYDNPYVGGPDGQDNAFSIWAYNYSSPEWANYTDGFIPPRDIIPYIPTLWASFAPHYRNKTNPGYVRYSDTNFLTLGLLIEEVTGMELHDAFRRDIWAPLGMDNTYMRWQEAQGPPGKENETVLSHRYTRNWPDKYVTYTITGEGGASADWGGGGVASTLDDMARFIAALETRKLLSEESTTLLMDWRPFEDIQWYGLGTQGYSWNPRGGLIDNGRGEVTMWGHEGYGGAAALWYMPLKIGLVGTLNNGDYPDNGLMLLFQRVLAALDDCNSDPCGAFGAAGNEVECPALGFAPAPRNESNCTDDDTYGFNPGPAPGSATPQTSYGSYDSSYGSYSSYDASVYSYAEGGAASDVGSSGGYDSYAESDYYEGGYYSGGDGYYSGYGGYRRRLQVPGGYDGGYGYVSNEEAGSTTAYHPESAYVSATPEEAAAETAETGASAGRAAAGGRRLQYFGGGYGYNPSDDSARYGHYYPTQSDNYYPSSFIFPQPGATAGVLAANEGAADEAEEAEYCSDDPLPEFVDSEGRGCAAYDAEPALCASAGSFALDEVDAVAACCACQEEARQEEGGDAAARRTLSGDILAMFNAGH